MTTSSPTLDPELLDALRALKLSPTSQDIVKLGIVAGARLESGRALVDLELPSPEHPRAALLAEEARVLLKAHPGIREARVEIRWRVRPAQTRIPALPGVKNVIAVASGKGGVGKSTIASNLAVGLRLAGARAGLLDLDIFGPSAPIVLGAADEPEMTEDERLIPPVAHGVPYLSMGMLAPGDRPIVWRGPMLHKAVMQFTTADWGDLDYLVLDLPPGTGDVQLTVTQSMPVAGAVIVTTPQPIALLDATKGLAMFEGARIPILGIVENMAEYICTKCGKRHAIFSADGGRRLAEERGVPLLARIPLQPEIMRGADSGAPVVLDARSAAGAILRELAARVAADLGERSLRRNPFKVLA